MILLTHCQHHILTANIWFVWYWTMEMSQTNDEQGNIGLLRLDWTVGRLSFAIVSPCQQYQAKHSKLCRLWKHQWIIDWQNKPIHEPLQVLYKYLWHLRDTHPQLWFGTTHLWSSKPPLEPRLCCRSSRTPHMRNPPRGTFWGHLIYPPPKIVLVLWLPIDPDQRVWRVSTDSDTKLTVSLGQPWVEIGMIFPFACGQEKPGAQQSSRGRRWWKARLLAMLTWEWLRPAGVDPVSVSFLRRSSPQPNNNCVSSHPISHPSSPCNLHLSKRQPTNKSSIMASFQLLNYLIFHPW